MFVPVFALALATHLVIAVADSVPILGNYALDIPELKA